MIDHEMKKLANANFAFVLKMTVNFVIELLHISLECEQQ